jgi:hypothetical protein
MSETLMEPVRSEPDGPADDVAVLKDRAEYAAEDVVMGSVRSFPCSSLGTSPWKQGVRHHITDCRCSGQQRESTDSVDYRTRNFDPKIVLLFV